MRGPISIRRYGHIANSFEHTMTPHQLVGLFTRLFAIWLFISGTQMIGAGMSLRDSANWETEQVLPT